MYLSTRHVFVLFLAIAKLNMISAQIQNSQNVMRVLSIDLNPKSQRHSSPLTLFNTMSSRPEVILQIERSGPISVERSSSDNQHNPKNTRTFTIPGSPDINREISIQTNPFGEIVLDILPDATVNLRKESQIFETTDKTVPPDHLRLKQNAEYTQTTEGHRLDSRNTNPFILNTRGTMESQTHRIADPSNTNSTNSNKEQTRKQSEQLSKQLKNSHEHYLNSNPFKHNPDGSKPPTEHDFLRHKLRMIQENGQSDPPTNEVTNARFHPFNLFPGPIPTDAFLNPFTHGMLPFSDGDNEPGPFFPHPNHFFFNHEIPPQNHQNTPTFPDHEVQGENRNHRHTPDIMDMFFHHRIMDGMEGVSTISKPILTRPMKTVIVNDSIGVSSSLNDKHLRRKQDQSNLIIENITILPVPVEQRNSEMQVKSPIPGPLTDRQHRIQKGVKVVPFQKEPPKTVTIDRRHQFKTEHATKEKPTKSPSLGDILNNINIPPTTSLLSILSGEMVNPQFAIGTPPPQFTDELVNPHFVDGLFNLQFSNVQLPAKTPNLQQVSRNHSNNNSVANNKPSFALEIGGTSSTNGEIHGFPVPQKAVGGVLNIHTSIAKSEIMSSPAKKDITTTKGFQHTNNPRDTVAKTTDLISSNTKPSIPDHENKVFKNMEQNNGPSLNIPSSLTPEVYMSAKPEFGLFHVNNVSVSQFDIGNGIIVDLHSNTPTFSPDRDLFNILGVGATNNAIIVDIRAQKFETAVKSNSLNTSTDNDQPSLPVEIGRTLPTTGAPHVPSNFSTTIVIDNIEPMVVANNSELNINNETMDSTLTNNEEKQVDIMPQNVDFSTINTTTPDTVQQTSTIDKQTDKKKDKKKKSSKKKRKNNKKSSNKSKSKTPDIQQNEGHTQKSEKSKTETENKTQEQMPKAL